MKTNILLTGFEPFGGEAINPSWLVAQALDQKVLAGASRDDDILCEGVVVHSVMVPCVFGEAISALHKAISQYEPQIVICLGQAGGRAEITPERVAINIDDARIPDNQQKQPIDQPVVQDGPAAYFSNLPVKAMVSAMKSQGIPAALSNTAGTFVCNHLFYGLMHLINTEHKKMRGGFIHIPYLPEQTLDKPGIPAMSLTMQAAAIEQAMLAAVNHQQDIKVIGGTTH